jgi:amidase
VLGSIDDMYWNFRYIQGFEAWAVDGPLITRFGPPLGPGVAERFEWSKQVTDAQYAKACNYRSQFRQHLADLLGTDGVLVLPTAPDIAPLRGQAGDDMERYRNRAIQMLCIAGLSGFPQISMPLGQRLGAPLGISLLGPAGSDASLVTLVQRIAEQKP